LSADLLPYHRDEDLLAWAARTGRPGLRAIGFPEVAVVIGRGGKIQREVYVDRLAADGVPLLRRRGGGCAVVLDPGNVVVSVALPWPGVGQITSAFARISDWFSAALAECGVPEVRRDGISDLVLGEQKLGGSCIWRTRGLVYYAATLLVDPDLELIDRYLPHPPREPAYRRGRQHRQFLTTLAQRRLPRGTPVGAEAFADILTPVLERSLAALAVSETKLPKSQKKR
jgi:lipoate-protein ligase A